MEKIIKGKMYMFKEDITGRQEQASGILKFMTSIEGRDKTKISSSIMFDDEFNKATLKLVNFMSVRPKLTVDDLLDNFTSADLLELKLECLLMYAESLKGLEDFSKKKTILNPSSMESYESLGEKIHKV